jgi:hypothetical protein
MCVFWVEIVENVGRLLYMGVNLAEWGKWGFTETYGSRFGQILV